MQNRKFILKQWYPSLGKKVKVGDIFIKTNNNSLSEESYVPHLRDDVKLKLNVREVQSNPEFWEELESEYIILSVVVKGEKFTLVSPGTFQSVSTLRQMDLDFIEDYKANVYEIIGVQRTTDGIMFGTDEPVVANINGVETLTEIKQFKMNVMGGMDVICGESKDIRIDLNDITPRKFLFTTEDGIDIHVGETFNVVEDDTLHIHPNVTYPAFCGNTKKHKRFKYLDQAKTYVGYNKKKLSVEEIKLLINLNASDEMRLVSYMKENYANIRTSENEK